MNFSKLKPGEKSGIETGSGRITIRLTWRMLIVVILIILISGLLIRSCRSNDQPQSIPGQYVKYYPTERSLDEDHPLEGCL